MCSERKISANRRNAEKSTGPKTDAGKAKSRRNSLKHGLTGDGAVLRPNEVALFQERLELWTVEERPGGAMEEYVLGCAVLASIRIDRCAHLDIADVDKRRATTVDNWERRQRRRVKNTVVLLAEDPGRTVERMLGFTRGCDWLLDQWEALGKALADATGWNSEQDTLALQLMGIAPEDDDEQAKEMRLNQLADSGEVDLDAVDAHFGVDTSALTLEQRTSEARSKLPGCAAARAALAADLEDEVEGIREHRETLWRDTDAPKLKAEIDLSSFDRSPEGNLRRRYQSTNSLDFHRNINQMRQQRKDARRDRNAEDKNPPTTVGQYWPDGEPKHKHTKPVIQPFGGAVIEAPFPEPACEQGSDACGASQAEVAVPPPEVDQPIRHALEGRPADCETHYEETAHGGPTGVLDERRNKDKALLRNEPTVETSNLEGSSTYRDCDTVTKSAPPGGYCVISEAPGWASPPERGVAGSGIRITGKGG